MTGGFIRNEFLDFLEMAFKGLFAATKPEATWLICFQCSFRSFEVSNENHPFAAVSHNKW